MAPFNGADQLEYASAGHLSHKRIQLIRIGGPAELAGGDMHKEYVKGRWVD